MTDEIVDLPRGARAIYVMAHGAGAGMRHPFLAAVAAALSTRRIATLRYEFPYMTAKKKRVDAPEVAHAAVRAAVDEAKRRAPGVPLFAGGKSFGGRMTSQAEAIEPLGVRGLVFLGFPLHAPGKPGIDRAAHLADVGVPMLFLQGTRDEFARLDLLRAVTGGLARTTVHLIEGADHGFRARGRKQEQIVDELAGATAAWIASVARKR